MILLAVIFLYKMVTKKKQETDNKNTLLLLFNRNYIYLIHKEIDKDELRRETRKVVRGSW